MKFESTIKIQSKLYPDVTYTLRKMTRGRRVEFDTATGALVEEDRALLDQLDDLERELKPHRVKAKEGPCTCSHLEIEHDPQSFACTIAGCTCRQPQFPPDQQKKLLDLLNKRFMLDRNKFRPAIINWGLSKITGVEIDGKPVDHPQALIDGGPEDLVDEISDAIMASMRLTEEERKNSASPTTSGAPVDGEKKSSGAASANGAGSTIPVTEETADYISAAAFV